MGSPASTRSPSWTSHSASTPSYPAETLTSSRRLRMQPSGVPAGGGAPSAAGAGGGGGAGAGGGAGGGGGRPDSAAGGGDADPPVGQVLGLGPAALGRD